MSEVDLYSERLSIILYTNQVRTEAEYQSRNDRELFRQRFVDSDHKPTFAKQTKVIFKDT